MTVTGKYLETHASSPIAGQILYYYCSSDKFRILCLFLSIGRPGPTLYEQEVHRKKFTVYPEKRLGKLKTRQKGSRVYFS